MTILQRRLLIGLAVICLVAQSCAKGGINTPQVQIADYGTKVLQAVRAGQEAVIAANKSTPDLMSDANTRKVLDNVKVVAEKAQQLKAALVAYDAATSLDFRSQRAADVRALVAQVTQLASVAFNVQVSPELSLQLNNLAVNIIAAVEAVKLELDKLK